MGREGFSWGIIGYPARWTGLICVAPLVRLNFFTNHDEPITNNFFSPLLILLRQGFLLRFTMADKPADVSADKLLTPHLRSALDQPCGKG